MTARVALVIALGTRKAIAQQRALKSTAVGNRLREKTRRRGGVTRHGPSPKRNAGALSTDHLSPGRCNRRAVCLEPCSRTPRASPQEARAPRSSQGGNIGRTIFTIETFERCLQISDHMLGLSIDIVERRDGLTARVLRLQFRLDLENVVAIHADPLRRALPNLLVKRDKHLRASFSGANRPV